MKIILASCLIGFGAATVFAPRASALPPASGDTIPTQELPRDGFVTLNDMDTNAVALTFNYRIFWDRSVCGFLVLRDSPDGPPVSGLLNELKMSGQSDLDASVLPHADQLVFKVTQQKDRGLAQFVLKARQGTIKDAISKILYTPDERVILMFSRNCVGMP